MTWDYVGANRLDHVVRWGDRVIFGPLDNVVSNTLSPVRSRSENHSTRAPSPVPARLADPVGIDHRVRPERAEARQV